MSHAKTELLGTTEQEDPRGPTNLQLALRDLRRRPPAMFGLICIATVLIWAIIPGIFAPLDPTGRVLATVPIPSSATLVAFSSA